MLKAAEDLILYLLENWRSLTVQGALTAAILIFVKRIGIRQLKKLLHLKENAELERIEHKLDLLLKERGISWNADICNPTTKYSVRTRRIEFRYSVISRVRSAAQRVIWCHINWSIRRGLSMREYLKKLGSRKFQAFVGGFITQLFILLKLDEGLYTNEIAAAGLIITTIVYIYVEGSVDKSRGAKANEEHYGDSGPAV